MTPIVEPPAAARQWGARASAGVARTTAVGMPTRWRSRARAATLTAALDADEGGAVEREQLEEMGPIDYVVIEWPRQQPVGEAAPLILDAVD
jgi:hypothetical protein